MGSSPTAPTLLAGSLWLIAISYMFDYETRLNGMRGLLHISEKSSISLNLLEKFVNKGKRIADKKLSVSIDGINFENPVLVAAGWDKVGKNVSSLYQLGFAGVEVGSVIAYPQPGNARPRFFMIGPGVTLNSFGFNSPGMESVAKNLEAYRNLNIPIGINIGKNKHVPNKAAPELYTVVLRRLYEFATYFVINISSPNSPNLRKLQEKELLNEILSAVTQVMQEIGGRKPLFVKIAPELSFKDIDDVINLVYKHKLTGIIATNTTTNHHLKAKYGSVWEDRAGGLSGDDIHYRSLATKQVAHIYRETKGKIKIIGVGGVKDASTALEKIKAGASLVQVMSAIQAQGFSVAGKINQGILEYMQKEKIKSLQEIVGIDAKKWF